MSTAEYPWPQPEADAPPPIPAAAPIAAPAMGLNVKNPLLAAGLSLFPGVGNIYNGLYLRGLTFFLIIASLIAIAGKEEIFGFAVAFFWLFNVIDAYRQATLINYGYAQDLGALDLPKHPRASQGGLAAGVILTLVGLFAFLDRYFYIDLEWLVDLWPLALMGIGVWMIVGSIRDRRKRAARIPEI